MDYKKALAAALHRKQVSDNAAAERYAIARSPICYAPNQASLDRSIQDDAMRRLRLCIHGRVPRLIATRMKMPRLGCRRCA